MPDQDEQRQPQTGGTAAGDDQTYEPGRTSQAEGTRETVEEDLGQKTEQDRDRGSAIGPDQTDRPGRTSQAEGTRETVEEDLREKTE